MRAARLTRALAVAGSMLAGLARAQGAAGTAAPPKLVFVVNRDNPVTSLRPSDVADYFLKKQNLWFDGTPVRFIDWRDGTPQRTLFLDRILSRTSREVELYWIGQKLYSGNSAPVRASSDAVVTGFVARFKGAIGYVSDPESATKPGVRRIEVRGAD